MTMRIGILFLTVGVAALGFGDETKPWKLDFEIGAAYLSRNDVRIPGDMGTKFSFGDLIGKGRVLTARIDLTFERGTGPGWRVLYAPLVASGSGEFGSAVDFEGTTFAAGVPTDGRYQFNSYRATYRNRWKQGPTSDWRIGGTLKVRDAEVRISQGGVTRSNKNVGFVPLLHVYGEERLGDRWLFTFDFDGLAAPQGRAFDVSTRLGYEVSPGSSVFLAYRTLEGGVSNDKVFNFFWGNSVVLGWSARF
ncbi:MAG: hypothetical protein ACKVQS_06855 [Fimbriimonadaceae bacterium]